MLNLVNFDFTGWKNISENANNVLENVIKIRDARIKTNNILNESNYDLEELERASDVIHNIATKYMKKDIEIMEKIRDSI